MPSKSAKECISRSIIANIIGPRGSGKSHFAISETPRPLRIQGLDPTFRAILGKFDLDDVGVYDYEGISPELLKAVSGVKSKEELQKSSDAFTKMQKEAEGIWSQYVKDFYEALDEAATVVWDTGSENWELLRLARFGRLAQIEPHQYSIPNTEYRSLIRAAQSKGVNLIILSKTKEKWGETVSGTGVVRRGPTGEFEMQGFSHLGYEVTFEAETYHSSCTHRVKERHPGACNNGDCNCSAPCGADGLFHLRIVKCTQQPSLLYEDISDPSWTLITSLIYPEG